MSVPVPVPSLDPRRWWALAVFSLTQLVVVLDATIVNVALPRAQEDLGMTDAQRQWVVTAYVLAFGALLLLGGRVADYWGRKRGYVVGMLGFGAASAWGGLAHSPSELILARGLQGVFAALLAPAALALLTVTFPSGRERGTAFAVFGTVAGTGAAVGLALGGTLTQFAGWRWCLLVNIAFALVGLVGALAFVSESRADGDNRYDVAGAVTVTLGLGGLVFGFTRAEAGWTDSWAVTSLALGLVLLVLFVWIESRVAQPLLPLRVVRDRVRAGALLIQAIVGAVFIGMTLYLAFHLQIVLGLSPLLAGLASLGMTVATMVTAPVAARLFARFGARVLMTAGPLVAAAGMLHLTRITPDGGYWDQVLPGLLVTGVGIACTIVPLQNVALAGVAPRDAGAASALVNSVMQIGGCIALSVFTTIYLATVEGAGGPPLRALTDGYAAVFLATAVVLVIAALIAATTLGGHRAAPSSQEAGHGQFTHTG
ncbi:MULTISPECIES: MFS transporter [Saccharothrix]|uniref:MFS transporter n=1 Tax=Saccharothrix TaxID=2071 RepID=UPI00093D64A8|nr:MFS transporter [Saccharothrix sp. CB00851]OKI20295.1 Puromycin resistance protein pur8 [Saccharothrix sp. CB00851]